MKLFVSIFVTIASLCAQSVQYHGGPVLTGGARVHFMYYGDVSEANKQAFRDFTIGAPAGYLNKLVDYYDANNVHIANTAAVIEEANMGTPFGTSITAVQAIQAAQQHIIANGLTCDSGGVYVLMFGLSISVTGFYGASSHGAFPCGVVPNPPPNSAYVAAIYNPGVSVINFSHELVEAMTNPFPWDGWKGWYQDSSGLEIADPGVCGTASQYSLPTGIFTAANYWKLVGGGCTTGNYVPPPPPPPPGCPPGTKPQGNSGKCK